jgi:hypothetical protein
MAREETTMEHCREKAEFSENCGTEREDCHLEPFVGDTEHMDSTIPYSTE